MVALFTVKRVYVLKGDKKATKTMKDQTMSISAAAFATVRASNRLGFPGHRATITLVSGAEIDVAQTLSEVQALVRAAR